MKKTLLVLSLASISVITSCRSSNADSAIAADMCNCFNMLKDSIPAEGLKVFEKAAIADNAQETFSKEMANLPAATAQKVNAALLATAKPGSGVNDCLKGLDKKYKTPTNDQQAMTQRMIEALKDQKGCEIMLSLMRMNQKTKK